MNFKTEFAGKGIVSTYGINQWRKISTQLGTLDEEIARIRW